MTNYEQTIATLKANGLTDEQITQLNLLPNPSEVVADPLANVNLQESRPLDFNPETIGVEGNATFPTLSQDDQERAISLASHLKVNDSNGLISFGSETQQSLGAFSSQFVNKVENKDLGEIGDTLRELMLNLKEVNEPEAKGIFSKLFAKSKQKVSYAVAGYQKASNSISVVKKELSEQQEKLSNSNIDLEKLYAQNVVYYQDLNVLIAAGEYKIKELREVIIPPIEAEAQKSNDQMITQEVKDLYDYLNRLEKRIYDLTLTREISIQQAPQIRLIQKTNMDLVQKIQSSINTAIPLWTNQVALYITLMQQEGAVKATKIISDTTNKLLVKNSEMLKLGSIAAAVETERGVVDLETLRITQVNLISTISETLRIQQEGAVNRANAAIELNKLENELKEKLLEVTTDYKGAQGRRSVTDTRTTTPYKSIRG